jgi:hypothetical protein
MHLLHHTAILAVFCILSAGCIGSTRHSNTPQTAAPICQNDPKSFQSSRINDSAFHNVIEITDKDLVSNGIDLLFKVPIAASAAIPVIFVQTKVPLHLLPGIYPEFPKIIVITPNWFYYEEPVPNGVYCAEPMESSIIYEFSREGGNILKDSMVMMGGFPKMSIAKPYKLKGNEREIYFTESIGSACCPRDLQWDNKPSQQDFVSNFEKQNNVDIAGTFRQIMGKEGEAIYYYTLKGLNDTQRLKFIVERNYSRIINRQTKELIKRAKIFTPTVLKIDFKISCL